jgi:hypothetical protein
MPFADNVDHDGSRSIIPQTPTDSYTQRPVVDLPDAEPSYPFAWSAQPTSIIALKSTDTNGDAERVSHVDPTYMLGMIVVTVLMHVGVYICMRSRRSSRGQRIQGLVDPKPQSMPSSQRVHSYFWPADPTDLGNEAQHWIDYKTISESVTAAEQGLGWPARCYAPG